MIRFVRAYRKFLYLVIGCLLIALAFSIPLSVERYHGFLYSGSVFIAASILLFAEIYYRSGAKRWFANLFGVTPISSPATGSSPTVSGLSRLTGPSAFYGGLGGLLGALIAGPLLASTYIAYNSRPGNPDPEPAFMKCNATTGLFTCPRFYFISVSVILIAAVYGHLLGKRLHLGCKAQHAETNGNSAILSSRRYKLQRLKFCIQPAIWTAVWVGIPIGVLSNFLGGSVPPFYEMAIAAVNAVTFVSFCILGAFAGWRSKKVFNMIEIDLIIIAISLFLTLDSLARSFFAPITSRIDLLSNYLLNHDVFTLRITWQWALYVALSIPASLMLALFIAFVLTLVISLDAMSAAPNSMYFPKSRVDH